MKKQINIESTPGSRWIEAKTRRLRYVPANTMLVIGLLTLIISTGFAIMFWAFAALLYWTAYRTNNPK